MIETTVYRDETIALELRQIARNEGRSQAELIREAVRMYTSTADRPRPKGIGAHRSGRGDVSERAEEILRDAARRRR